MRRSARFLAALAMLALVFGPALAEARPGGGFSSGSRGSRSFSPPPATRTIPNTTPRPFDRSATPPTRPAAPATPGAAAPARGGMFGGGFMAGMMGGLIGVGLGGLLFGNGLFGGISGFAGILGLLLQVALIVFAVRFVMKLIRNRQQPAMAGGPRPQAAAGGPAPAGSYARQMQDGRPMGGMGAGGAPAGVPVQVGPADFQAFERLLRDINIAWTRRDEPALASLATAEMASYFRSDLRDLAARNWQNETRDVKLEQGDLSEAWREGNAEYATVAMRFSLVDVTRDMSNGAVVEGDPESRKTVSELWTFVRQNGGAWRLSAIQQPG
ncbi:TIM44-like domain-containing protein [Roseomonas marmotae]|uniref:TIM44-like domain-containing protein n=1 Tax=Roseomonas marmotae TaxID=2768161 RepID=A0ABS3K8B3_9PROT|nr:TIM44-like domain-containing protein [Roseomonas marmotae]MBO1073160.1 TIM44-like domain-containing protein [Roseomonas marmotae]QTI79205.1 TIM44-like domain-containing protein [Roseomonas marmotae]